MTDHKQSFEKIYQSIALSRKHLSEAYNNTKMIEKQTNKELKQYQRLLSKNKKGNKTPSGFATPGVISSELCMFMEVEGGTTMARTDVTKFIMNYVKTNQLQNPDNKQFILPDVKLKTLLDIQDEPLKYFGIQKYMNKHFIR
jgi:chromatin remodeling complex protein RSC6